MCRALVSLALAVVALATVLFLRSDSRGDGPAAATAAASPSATKPQTETAPKSPDKASPSRAGETLVQRALDEPTEFDFIDTPLKDVLDSIAVRHKINVILDIKSLSDAGITGDTPITKIVKGIPLRSALYLTLAEKDLAFVANGDNVLLISTSDAAKRQLVRHVYDVRKFASPAGEFSDGKSPWARLEEIIPSTVESTTWSGFGGTGSLSVVDGKLIVSQTAEVQSQIAAMLSGLEAARQQDVAALRKGAAPAILCSPSTSRAQVDSALDSRIDLDFADTPLKDVVDFVQSKLNIPIQLDTKNLTDAGVTGDTPISFRLKQVDARLALRNLLLTRELDFVVDHDVVVITTTDAANAMMTTVLYPVADLVGDAVSTLPDESDYALLIEAIIKNVRPESWKQASGAGSVAAFLGCKVLVVRQTEQAHQEIAEVLSKMREVEKNHPEAAQASSAVTPDVRVYLPPASDLKSAADDKDCQQFADMIRKLIEPKSWNDPNTYVGCTKGTVVVRQTPKVHRQIQRLINEINSASSCGLGGAMTPPALNHLQQILSNPLGPF